VRLTRDIPLAANKFILPSSHTIEELQGFSNTRTPSPVRRCISSAPNTLYGLFAIAMGSCYEGCYPHVVL
jgi:hypothetical protein